MITVGYFLVLIEKFNKHNFWFTGVVRTILAKIALNYTRRKHWVVFIAADGGPFRWLGYGNNHQGGSQGGVGY